MILWVFFFLIYSHVNDIDVFVGGITETPRDDALVGPLFECLLGRQFRDLKFGDRYWYETKGVQGFIRGIYLNIFFRGGGISFNAVII